jgi:hypothetical protein
MQSRSCCLPGSVAQPNPPPARAAQTAAHDSGPPPAAHFHPHPLAAAATAVVAPAAAQSIEPLTPPANKVTVAATAAPGPAGFLLRPRTAVSACLACWESQLSRNPVGCSLECCQHPLLLQHQQHPHPQVPHADWSSLLTTMPPHAHQPSLLPLLLLFLLPPPHRSCHTAPGGW